MKFSKKLLLGLSAICMLSLCALPNALNDSNNFSESTNLRNAVGIKLQATNNDEGLVEVSETFVQTGLFVDDKDVTHNYLRFATAINLSNNNGISSLEYVRKVGDNEKAIEVKTVYKKLSAENNNYYSYNGEELTTDEVSNDWYFACYTVDIQSEEYKSKDFKLSLRVNNKEVYAYTAASLNTLNSNHYLARFENEGELLGKQFVSDNVAPTYLGEELTKEADDHTYTFGWDKELAPLTEDTTYSVAFKKNHHYGEGTRNTPSSDEHEKLYEVCQCTVAGCQETISNEIGYVLQGESSQRRLIGSINSADETWALRLQSSQYIEYNLYSTEEADVTFSLDLLSRQQYSGVDFSPFMLYTITINGIDLEQTEDTTTLSPNAWGSKWKARGNVVVGKVHLHKGSNFIRVLSRETNKAHIDFLKFEHNGNTSLSLANITQFEAVDGNITFNSTSSNGIYDDTSYLSEFSKGSNVRLTTGDYDEFTFTSDKDIYATVYTETNFRTTVYNYGGTDKKELYDGYKIFIKEDNSAYSEILRTDERAYDQIIYKEGNSDKKYFDVYKVVNLSLKAGTTYTLKFQARNNLQMESIWLAHNSDATISLVK